MDERERQEFDLEDIIKEFGGTPKADAPEAEVPQEQPEEDTPEEQPQEELLEDLPWQMPSQEQPADLEQTRRIEPVQTESSEEVSGDTIRLDGLPKGIAGRKKEEAPLDETRVAQIWNPEDTIHNAPFSENWEPEYDQPMGEYVPPQPIRFQPRSRLNELKRKLIEGPEKRFYELSEKGVGRLQAAIFLSAIVVLISAISTGMYAFGAVQENRLRLMVFGQLLAMLVSALLGSNQLIEGVADMVRKKFSLNSLLVITFLVCFADAVVCLKQLRVPCCAAFSLEMTMSLWSTYQRRSRDMSQLDTLRRATRLDGVTACSDYLDDKKGFLRKDGRVEDFMENFEAMGRPERTLNRYSLIAMITAFLVGISAGVMTGLSDGFGAGFCVGLQVAAVSLLAAVPATAFICQSRPAWVLERRLHKLGTVLCGWQGVEGLSGNSVFPLTYQDLYPAGTVRLNGVKYFGSRDPDVVVAYAAAVVSADKCGLEYLFSQVLDIHNGRHYDATDLFHYENGGVRGMVEGENVLLGSVSFMKDMGIDVPENARLGYAVYVAIEGELSGLFAVSYEKSQSTAAGLTTLNSYRKLQCVLTSDDFMLTHGFLRSKFDIKPKRFLLPDYGVRETLRQKEAEPDAECLLMTTSLGLAPIAYGVTGARVLRNTCRMGTVLHIIGGALGLAIMILLVVLGALELLTPANMFLYQLVWMIPAILITEWTHSI